MANEKLLATLNETRSELVLERVARIERLHKAQCVLNDARINLRSAQSDEQAAIHADESAKEKVRVLTDSLNGMGEKPQYLIEKLGRLQADQLGTYRDRKMLGDISRLRQREMTGAETQVAVAQTELDSITKDITDIDAKIRSEQGQ